eukprot:Sspe_Gene.50121::Locus_27643_Transcript_1_1_Confidence_1.000_Length_2831::g.50121::m.50121
MRLSALCLETTTFKVAASSARVPTSHSLAFGPNNDRLKFSTTSDPSDDELLTFCAGGESPTKAMCTSCHVSLSSMSPAPRRLEFDVLRELMQSGSLVVFRSDRALISAQAPYSPPP